MKILGIETSCDETGAAVIEASTLDQPVRLISNSLATSMQIHSYTGGIIPENAAREQVKYIIPVIFEALKKAELDIMKPEIDAIAVTYGPGLIGSLLVGVETAKTLSYIWNIPVVPVNHLHGHLYANWITRDSTFNKLNEKENESLLSLPSKPSVQIEFPAIALVVSGGHTDLILIKGHGDIEVIGGTRDDAAGEAFDKIGRLLGLAYPAGIRISELAEKGNADAFTLPRPMWDSKDYDFSFSGLKTAVLNLIKRNNWEFNNDSFAKNEKLISDISACVQKAIIDVLVFKTLNSVKEYKVRSLLLGGGVAANSILREEIKAKNSAFCKNFYVPAKEFCTDNAAMIAAAGYYNYKPLSFMELTANPQLYY